MTLINSYLVVVARWKSRKGPGSESRAARPAGPRRRDGARTLASVAIPEFELRRVRALLERYCEARVPPHVRHKLTLGFSVRGSAVTLFERRPRFDAPSEWLEHGVARFRYSAAAGSWSLYCMHRDLKWHRYLSCGPAKRFETLLDEVQADPTGIFWG